jgi:predicted DNA-binding transcriptional regulator AlpA
MTKYICDGAAFAESSSRVARKLINKKEVQRLFGVSKSTIDRWLRDGKLPKPQRRFGFARWDYEELIARLKVKRK